MTWQVIRRGRTAASITCAVALAVGVGTACSAKGLTECEDLVATSERLATCQALPEASRAALVTSAARIKEVLASVEAAGGVEAGARETVEAMRKVCRSQHARVLEEMRRTAPGCVP